MTIASVKFVGNNVGCGRIGKGTAIYGNTKITFIATIRRSKCGFPYTFEYVVLDVESALCVSEIDAGATIIEIVVNSGCCAECTTETDAVGIVCGIAHKVVV